MIAALVGCGSEDGTAPAKADAGASIPVTPTATTTAGTPAPSSSAAAGTGKTTTAVVAGGVTARSGKYTLVTTTGRGAPMRSSTHVLVPTPPSR